ncbi:MAG: hypothetical protein PWQ35_261 [Patescibacteria group bacterium]|nr:hypothetical protein [Patescibacteria group bacterium]
MIKKITTIIFVLFSFFLFSQTVLAEIDTDGDSYSDEAEIRAGYSPFNSQPIKATNSDVDGDGLSDYFEYVFGTNPDLADSDGDSYNDFLEIDNAFNPNSPVAEKLPVRIEINLGEQTLAFFVAEIKWREFKVSTGKKSMPTPSGEFKIVNKIEKAWSRTYGLWMPFWLGLDRGGIGIHELPFWPSGYREGEDHLGQAVSHGCIRLGIGAAEYVYNHLKVGDVVLIRP